MCQRLEEPKNKTNIVYMNLKRRSELWSKKFVEDGVIKLKMRSGSLRKSPDPNLPQFTPEYEEAYTNLVLHLLLREFA